MRKIALVIAFFVGLIAPAAAQRADIEAANAKWVAFFNKGDFDGVAALYTADAAAFPPGAAMVKGRAAIGAMWKGMAAQVSDPKVTTLDVKRLGPSAAREIGTFSLKTKETPPSRLAPRAANRAASKHETPLSSTMEPMGRCGVVLGLA